MFFASNLDQVRLEWTHKLRDAMKSEDRAASLLAIADEGERVGPTGPFLWFHVALIRNAAKSVGSPDEGRSMDSVRQIIRDFEYLKRRGERISALMSDESRKAQSESQKPQARPELIWVTKGNNQTGDA